MQDVCRWMGAGWEFLPAKVGLVVAKSLFIGGWQGSDLTRADQVTPGGLVYDSISGSTKPVNKLNIKSLLGDVGLSVKSSILGLSCSSQHIFSE